MHGWYFDFSKVPKPQQDLMSETQETTKTKTSSKKLFNTSIVTNYNDEAKNNGDSNSNTKNRKAKSSISDEMEDYDYSYEQDSSIKNKKNDFIGKRRFLPANTRFNSSVKETNSHIINNTNIQLPNTVFYNEREKLPSKEEIKILTIILTTVKDPFGEISTNHHLQYDTKLVSKLYYIL